MSLGLNTNHPSFGKAAEAYIAELEAVNAQLREERDALAAVVERCEATFWRYVETHLTKGTDDGNRKAKANSQLAEMCAATNYATILADRDERITKPLQEKIDALEAVK